MAETVPPNITAASALSTDGEKPIKALVLDAGPLLSNTISATSFISRAQKIYTTPQVISEIRDPTSRQRLETQWNVFLHVRAPRPESLKFVREFVKKVRTGDGDVLSSADWGILGLAFELECELRGDSDWTRKEVPKSETVTGGDGQQNKNTNENEARTGTQHQETSEEAERELTGKEESSQIVELQEVSVGKREEETEQDVEEQLSHFHISNAVRLESTIDKAEPESPTGYHKDLDAEETFEDDSDGEGWITPSNIHRHKAKSNTSPKSTLPPTHPIYAACSTTDFAMQNILLLLPIPLISPNNPQTRIRNLKTWLLRCHACFHITRTMSLQFCPRCGGPTLLRTSCSTDSATGKTRIYLKKNFQWNNRGTVYSIPKPTGGRASGKVGNGVREELILRADQKEYLKQREVIDRRKKKGEKDLMDRDYLPSILTGERRNELGEWVKIGHGKRNPNERRGNTKKR